MHTATAAGVMVKHKPRAQVRPLRRRTFENTSGCVSTLTKPLIGLKRTWYIVGDLERDNGACVQMTCRLRPMVVEIALKFHTVKKCAQQN